VVELTEVTWLRLREAAKPLIPDGEARAAVTAVLQAYPNFVYDRERMTQVLQLSARMRKRIDQFAELYQQLWFPRMQPDELKKLLAGKADAFLPGDVMAQSHFWHMKMLRRPPEHAWWAAYALRRANQGRRDSQREQLVSQLCSIYLDNFGGHSRGLTTTVPPLGGPPGGPLIEFLLVAMGEVIPLRQLPSRETLRDMIYRERQGRDRVAQLRFDLELRAKGDFDKGGFDPKK
jgi:hypothetical protein